MHRRGIFLVFVFTFFALSGTLAAQNNPSSTQSQRSGEKDALGFSSYAEFGGSVDSSEHVLQLDSTVGYNFTKHFGLDVGVPIYLVSGSSTTPTGGTTNYSNNGVGNPYADLRLKFTNPALNYTSMLRGYMPAADSKRGLSTGRATFDWTNHFDHSFSRLTPFAEVGLANTIVDTRYFHRPFTSLGLNTHFQGGLNIDLWKFFSVSTSAYDILPSGQQKIYSKVVARSSTMTSTIVANKTTHGRVFMDNAVSVGTADIARDHGFSGALDVSPSPYLDMEIGYTRSIHYDLNTVSFSIGVNLGKLVKVRSQH